METKKPRITWVTGASTGIGRALADVFTSRGDIVIASARTESKLNELRRQILTARGACEIIKCDVQSEASVSETVKKILELHGNIDVLINNAGVTYFKDFMDTSIEEFDHVINTNLRGPFLTTKAVLPAMLQNQTGLVLNILSYVVKEVYTKSAVYSSSKAGTEAMMNVLRSEVRRQGINIVNVYPGAVSTPIWRQNQLEKFGNQMLTPEQVAEMLYQVSIQPPSLMVEEIVLRPQGGDLQIS
jgi:Short-chain dehydrogenases of various substrate specificities